MTTSTKQDTQTELLNYVGGQWQHSQTDNYGEVHNPATAEVLAQVPLSAKEEVVRAVEASAKGVSLSGEPPRSQTASNRSSNLKVCWSNT